jgi:Arc/MetJ-type ribon-helix-helix transcriptional regulator
MPFTLTRIPSDRELQMHLALKPEHQKWITEQVARGNFSSPSEVLDSAIEQFRICSDLNLDWASDLIAAGDASLAEGRSISGEEFFSRLDARLAELKAE